MGVTCDTPGTASSPSTDGRIGDGAERQLIVAVRRDREEENLAHDRRDRRQDRTLDLRRQCAARPCQLLGHHLSGLEDVGAPVELNPHDGDADGGGGTDASYAGRAVHGGLEWKGDQCFHFLWRHAATFGEDGHRRCGQIRKDIDRHVAHGPRASRGEQHREREHQTVMGDRPFNESFHRLLRRVQKDAPYDVQKTRPTTSKRTRPTNSTS
jgi:hypothetical protein